MKKTVALLLVLALTLGCLSACTKKEGGSSSGGGSSSDSKELMTIEFYDVAANYQGTQSGWFEKVVKDRFNIEISIIAPQVSGGDIYQTRAASGNLGDIVILEATDFADCVKNGLIKDITSDIYNYKNLADYKTQIDYYNQGAGYDGKIYGIPTEMTNTSPTALSEDVIYSSPLLRWDLYNGVGAPEIKDLDGLLDVLKQIMDKYPTNADGDKAYPFSLWPDWDGGDGMLGIANVVQLTTWYGEKIKGSAILKPDNTFTPITDKNATYYKILKFLYKANKMGLMDPDSGTQKWDDACAKMTSGRVYLMWYSWQVGFWNSTDRLNDGTAFIFTPVQDQLYYADSDKYYGSGRVWGIGSKVDDAKYKRIMEFLDWYASPEGVQFQHCGIEGFNYEKMADGKFKSINDNALMDNLPVPEEYGGAGYNDGNNAINQWIVGSISTNPNTGEPYAKAYWASYKADTMGKTKQEWSAKFGAAEPVEWMKKNNKLLISPNVSVALPSDTPDIATARSQCNTEICDASWRMIYAKDDADFDAQWDQMTKNLDSFGFQELYKFDVDKAQIEVDAKKAAQ